jgi:hypothetical protein
MRLSTFCGLHRDTEQVVQYNFPEDIYVVPVFFQNSSLYFSRNSRYSMEDRIILLTEFRGIPRSRTISDKIPTSLLSKNPLPRKPTQYL